MTQEQLERWKDFAYRMARKGLGLKSRKSINRLCDCIDEFFEALQGELDWQTPCHDGLLARIRSWDNTGEHPTWRDEWGHPSNGPYVCDIVSGLGEQWNPYYWNSEGDKRYDRWENTVGSKIRSCLRAGLDMASEPSMGVMGFTAGDLRRMYPEGVPDWITGGKDHHWMTQHWKGEIPGVGLVPGECVENGTFDEMPDEAKVWL